MFFKIGVLKDFAIFTGKHLCYSLVLIVSGLKVKIPTELFSCKYSQILKNSFFVNTSVGGIYIIRKMCSPYPK